MENGFVKRVTRADMSALVQAAEPTVYWTDREDKPDFEAGIDGVDNADLVIVGGGFTGLWAAVAAAERDPGRRVVMLEAGTVGHGASGRNGGFCDASLTHGIGNGHAHWPDELPTLVRLGAENLQGLLKDLDRLGVDGDARPTSTLDAAISSWQLDDLGEDHELNRRYGHSSTLLDQDQVRGHLNSPMFVGGLLTEGTLALVDPGRLSWGLAGAARDLGVEIREQAAVVDISEVGDRLQVRVAEPARADGNTAAANGGLQVITAERVVVATNAWATPGRAMRRRIVPVYDHVLMTEPLSGEQRASIGWEAEEGAADAGNQFHYYRLTADGRILWGGYDANYHFGSKVDDRHEERTGSHELLAEHFFQTFPQLEGLGFSHRWAGPIATTARFTATWGTEHGGRTVWVGGYTGLGVGASRFGARVALDLVDGLESERTELAMVRSSSFPFPPEPLRWSAIQLTRRALIRSDSREGRRGMLLAALDRFGVGFNS